MSSYTKLSDNYPLDGAMKDLLDLFHQCNETTASNSVVHGQKMTREPHDLKHLSKIPDYSDKASRNKHHESATFYKSSSRADSSFNLLGSDDITIENLRQKQSELQNQLDGVLKVAKDLELKQKKKLTGLIHGNKSDQHSEGDDEEEDLELIEFHQIEIELRISELNRQLSNIQEELRLRLYRRLQSKTSGDNPSMDDHQQISNDHQRNLSLRRSSTQTDESTPTSSSCSDETTATSNTDITISRNSTDTELVKHFTKCSLSKPNDHQPCHREPLSKEANNDLVDGNKTSNANFKSDTSGQLGLNKETEKIDLGLALEHSYEVISHATKSIQQDKNNITSKIPSRILTTSNLNRKFQGNENNARNYDTQTSSNGYRNCPAAKDLERIEEGEEDDASYYCNSDKLRSIYEQKISPIIQATESDNSKWYDNSSGFKGQQLSASSNAKQTPESTAKDLDRNSVFVTPRASQDNRFNVNNINSSKRGNRPLTIYLPRPDEDINLLETIQSLGHDLDILSSDLKVTSTSAQGYLYKSCSSNVKKWVKRYFYFNRETKALSYYENKEQMTRKNDCPNCTIPFDEISDVYVEHRLSEKHKSTARKSYVFVLATIKRKYLLASSKAETMRAWIDILFTAAKANDYFQQLDSEGEGFSFICDSFRED